MNNDILMNDTFENINFSQIPHLITNSFSGISLTPLIEEHKENDSNDLKNVKNDIFLDDSIFLSQISSSDGNAVQENTNISSKSQIKNTNTCISNVEVIIESEEGKHTQTVLTQLNHTKKATKHSTIIQLNSWGLPENVLEKYESKKLKCMFPWQVECLSKEGVLEGRNLVYSAPTSAGKTLVAEIIAIKTILEKKKKVIFILPFVSIVREKMYYFQHLLETCGIRVDGFMGSYNPPGGFTSIQLAICTIEKANSLINRLMEEDKLGDIGAVLIDEIHLLGDPSRGYLLELLLTKLRYIAKKNNLSIQIIGMSATLPNLDQIAKWLDAELYTTDFRPVPLNEQAHICGEIYDKHLKVIRHVSLLQELKTDCDNILQLCLETIKESCSVLIFCPTKNWCENLAQQIATGFFKIGTSTSDWGELLRTQLDANLIMELLEQLKYCPVGLDAVLRKTVSFGVAFHHAGLTMDERDIIEGAFRNGALRVLVATSTLSSGVNLPARRVIIRTPIFHRKPLDSLIYRQMIGRAGRMGKDVIGESFLICQKNEMKIAKALMSAELSPVQSCLESAGKLKRAILEVVASGVASTPQDIKLFTDSTLFAVEESFADAPGSPIEETMSFLQMNEFVRLQKQDDGCEKYMPTALGKACLLSSIAPDEGLSLFAELEKARQCLVLETELHLIYLVTPYSACYSWDNIEWMFYLDLWEKLPSNMKKVGELVGIQDAYIIKATRGKIQTSTGKAFHKYLVHKRFFIALALQDLVNEKPLSWVCQKFNCNRGMLQSLQQSASSFAGMVTAFSRQLGWSSMELLLSQFQERMQFGVSRDLLDLMHLATLNGKMARSLYNAGIETVIQLANSDVSTIENILHRVAPFESEKEREGESEFDKKQRNKYRNVWITGKEGLTESEAAEIFVTEARKYLKIEMGLVDAVWNEGEQTNHENAEENIQEEHLEPSVTQNIHKSETLQNSEVEADSDTNEISKLEKKSNLQAGNIAPMDTDGHSKENSNLDLLQNDKKMDSSLSDDSSADSNINISDTSSISNTDSTKIEDIEDNNDIFKETSTILSEKLEKFSINTPQKCSTKSSQKLTTNRNLQIMAQDKDINNILDEISLSDFSETLSENSQKCSNIVKDTQKPSIIDVSQVIEPPSVELNISESSTQTNTSISLDKFQSDQSLFDDSFSLQLSEDNNSSKDSAYGGVKEKKVEIDFVKRDSLEKIFSESFHSDDDIFGQSIEEEHLLLSAKKRKHYNEERETNKKVKIDQSAEVRETADLNNSYILNKLENQPGADFSNMEIVNVCQEIKLLEAFSKVLKERTSFSLSVACSKLADTKLKIGDNIIKTQGPVLRNSDRKEERENIFNCDGRKVEGFSFSWEKNVVCYLSLENAKLHQKIIKLLKTVFGNNNITVKMFDSKEQIKMIIKCFGIHFSCKVDDPKIADWILDPEGKEKNLKAMVVKYCPEGSKLSQLSGGCKGVGSVGLDIYSGVNAKIRSSVEALLTFQLTDILQTKLWEEEPKYIGAYGLESSIVVSLAKMEVDGMSLNKTSLKTLLDTLKSQINHIEKRAYALAGRNFNFVSSADVAKVTGMFRGRKVSTRKQILEKNTHPISDLVLQWRKLHSVLTKAIYPLMQSVKDDRIHGCYITHTATGRISMHEPNLQNITKDFSIDITSNKENVCISCRQVFEAPEGYDLVSADYCQLELRILAHFSQDKLLCKIMREPGDVFKSIAAEWNKIKEEQVTDALRQNAKHLCYGIIYGMGSKTLSEQMNIEEMEAIEFMETFRNTYPGVKAFIKKTIETCRTCGYVETISGRRRFLPHINATEQMKKGQAERQAVNTKIQGSAADIVKKAMVQVESELQEIFHKTKSKPKMVLHLHDELMYEVPTKYLRKVARTLKKNMENSVQLSIPFSVKLKTGKSWGNMSELSL